VLTGVFVNGMFNDFGFVPAIVFYGIAFLADYKTTIIVKDYQRHETNPLFQIFSRRFNSNNIAFAMIFLIMVGVCIASYHILAEDTVLIYILGICHLCAGINNYHISKRHYHQQQHSSELQRGVTSSL